MIALFSGEPLDALWLAIAFTALQQIEGHIVAPDRVLAGAAHQPAAGDLRAAARRAAVRVPRRVHRAADRRDPARDGRLPAPARAPRAVGPARRSARQVRRSPPNHRLPSRLQSRIPSRRRRAAPSAAPRAGPAPRRARSAGPSSGTPTRRRRRPPPPRSSLGSVTTMADAALRADGVSKRYGERAALRDVTFAAGRGELLAIIGPNGAGKTTLLQIARRRAGAERGAPCRCRPREVGWVPQQPALYSKLSVAENLRLFARLEKVGDVEAAVDADARADRPRRAAPATRSGGSRAATSSGSTSRSACCAARPRCCSTSRRPRWTRASASACGASSAASPARARPSSTPPTTSARPSATPTGCSSSPTASCCSRARPAELERAVGDAADFESAFVRFLHERGH